MTDKPTPPVSMRKSAAKTPPGTKAAPADKPSPPRYIVIAAVALVLSGLSALAAAIGLLGQKTWLRDSLRDTTHNKLDDTFDKLIKMVSGTTKDTSSQLRSTVHSLPASVSGGRVDGLRDQVGTLRTGQNTQTTAVLNNLRSQLSDLKNVNHQIDVTVKSQIIAALVVTIAMSLAAFGAYRGRYWSRWAIIGLWALSTVTGTLVGLYSVLSIASTQPVAFKLPAFAAGILFLAAVVLTNLRPSIQYVNLTRPERSAARQRRGTLAPRERGGGAGRAATKAAPTKTAAAGSPGAGDRARTKQRSDADAVAKGAELARARARASKSRRTGA